MYMQEQMSGTVKSFVWGKGWGFITCDGEDVFFHVSDFRRGIPVEGTEVTFVLGDNPANPGKKVAQEIHGTDTPGSVQGTVKSFAGSTGYGFITVDGQDVFVHQRDVKVGGLKTGDTVWLDMEPSDKDPSKRVAKNVTGGTGHTDQGGRSEFVKGAKGCGKGGYGQMQDMMAAMMSTMMSTFKGGGMSSPYGKGKSSGGGMGGGMSSPYGGGKSGGGGMGGGMGCGGMGKSYGMKGKGGGGGHSQWNTQWR
eukprot:TRINITY_DN851_c0_g1_i1.p1 TRINITY_DN851_c0_g1~~TRINITY_DN851_c0_g1_i1.p1  ORF type:complete len:265 (+),score=62.24 TRINITY_DN851_c0_g1_i1:43-795(+)